MSVLGWIVIVAGALVFGVVAQLVVRTEGLPYRWVTSAIGAAIGAAAASEWLFPTATPEWEGIALVPAVVGGLVVGVIVDVIAIWYARSRAHGGQGHGSPVH